MVSPIHSQRRIEHGRKSFDNPGATNQLAQRRVLKQAPTNTSNCNLRSPNHSKHFRSQSLHCSPNQSECESKSLLSSEMTVTRRSHVAPARKAPASVFDRCIIRRYVLLLEEPPRNPSYCNCTVSRDRGSLSWSVSSGRLIKRHPRIAKVFKLGKPATRPIRMDPGERRSVGHCDSEFLQDLPGDLESQLEFQDPSPHELPQLPRADHLGLQRFAP